MTDKLTSKCDALLKLIMAIQPSYRDMNSDGKQLIETTIGAAIWYLPKSKKLLWSGKISQKAFRNGERSEDHIFPRRISAIEVLEKNWGKFDNPTEELKRLYINKYGKYNYVSRIENRTLIQHQKLGAFIDPKKCYEDAGIVLIPHPD